MRVMLELRCCIIASAYAYLLPRHSVMREREDLFVSLYVVLMVCLGACGGDGGGDRVSHTHTPLFALFPPFLT